MKVIDLLNKCKEKLDNMTQEEFNKIYNKKNNERFGYIVNIINKLILYCNERNYNIIRLNVEGEHGNAIVQDETGTPISIEYNKNDNNWV